MKFVLAGCLVFVCLIVSPTDISTAHTATCNDATWQWSNPLPQGNSLQDVWGAHCNSIFAVCGYGTVVHYNGSTWSLMPDVPNIGLFQIWGFSENDVYVSGSGGALLHYDGNYWFEVSNFMARPALKIWGVSGVLYFVTGEGHFYRYDGDSWQTPSVPALGLLALWGLGPDDVLVGGHTWEGVIDPEGVPKGKVCRWNNGAVDSYIFDDPVIGIWANAPDNIFVYTEGVKFYRYDGISWNIVTDSPGVGRMGGTSTSNLIVANGNGDLHQFNGTTFEPLCETGINVTSQGGDIHVTSDNFIAAVGLAGGAALVWDHFLVSKIQNDFSGFYDVWGSCASDVFAVGHEIAHYDGNVWSAMTKPVSDGLQAVWGAAPDTVVAVGNDGTVLYFDGISWTLHAYLDATVLFDVWGRSANDVYAVGFKRNPAWPYNDDGVVFHYDGSDWSPVKDDFTWRCYGVTGTASNVYVAMGGVLYEYDGVEWNSISNMLTTIHGVSATTSGDIFTVTDDKVGHYDGADWTETDLSHLLTSELNDVWASDPSNIWVVGHQGQILHFDGSGWGAADPLTGNQLNGIWGDDVCDLFAVGDQAIIFHYGGETQTPILITSFQARTVSTGIELYWDIFSDETIDHFLIHRERLLNGERFLLGDVLLNQPHVRRFIDTDVSPGETYRYTLAAVRPDGSEVLSQPVSITTTPIAFTLYQPFPNPFKPYTRIDYSLPAAARVSLRVYDVSGRLVTILLEGERSAGRHEVFWNGHDRDGVPVSSGVYFVHLQGAKDSRSRKIILLR